MKKLLTKGQIALLVIFSVLIIDQVIKIWIRLICIGMRVSVLQIGFIFISPKIMVWRLEWRYLENSF